ncbi:hypothetical protein K466DRAFT_205516 [Polyporus arcularius HHB13444]|uniref:Uncharacterized protein n=1 Tax=Polyporus arcularius HHB13444 TaxID=1314778 RepID=A0A5C3PTD2_9APHY|nr:hypothetical protein K466DRAFT_205516 [Polyporus arcularius HHB13444]
MPACRNSPSPGTPRLPPSSVGPSCFPYSTDSVSVEAFPLRPTMFTAEFLPAKRAICRLLPLPTDRIIGDFCITWDALGLDMHIGASQRRPRSVSVGVGVGLQRGMDISRARRRDPLGCPGSGFCVATRWWRLATLLRTGPTGHPYGAPL